MKKSLVGMGLDPQISRALGVRAAKCAMQDPLFTPKFNAQFFDGRR